MEAGAFQMSFVDSFLERKKNKYSNLLSTLVHPTVSTHFGESWGSGVWLGTSFHSNSLFLGIIGRERVL